MLPLLARRLATSRSAAAAAAAAPVRARIRARALATQRNTNPWLSDKSLYPLLAISGATIAFAAWFGPMWLYKSPEVQAPMRRRTTGFPTKMQPSEGMPFNENLYTKSEDMTKGIYRVTIKDTEGAKVAEGEEMGKRTEGK